MKNNAKKGRPEISRFCMKKKNNRKKKQESVTHNSLPTGSVL